MTYRVLDLFSGIGGFALGLEAAGMETVAFCEVAAAPRALLAHHWPEVPCYDDIRTLNAARLAADGIAVDVICGGFPCQDISFAGAGAGLAGERSGLWRDYARLIRELRPRYVIVENVAALLGRGLGDVLGDLAEIGYDAWWDCIPASAAGARHRRDRVWIVAYARGEQHEGFGDALWRQIAAELSRAYTEFRAIDLADADSSRGPARKSAAKRARSRSSACADGGHVSDPAIGERNVEPASEAREYQGQRQEPPGGRDRLGCLPDSTCDGRNEGRSDPRGGGPGNGAQQRPRPWGRGWWLSEPDVGRVAHGVPARVDRLHGLGNAVVPQIPEIIGRAIIAAEAMTRQAAA